MSKVDFPEMPLGVDEDNHYDTDELAYGNVKEDIMDSVINDMAKVFPEGVAERLKTLWIQNLDKYKNLSVQPIAKAGSKDSNPGENRIKKDKDDVKATSRPFKGSKTVEGTEYEKVRERKDLKGKVKSSLKSLFEPDKVTVSEPKNAQESPEIFLTPFEKSLKKIKPKMPSTLVYSKVKKDTKSIVQYDGPNDATIESDEFEEVESQDKTQNREEEPEDEDEEMDEPDESETESTISEDPLDPEDPDSDPEIDLSHLFDNPENSMVCQFDSINRGKDNKWKFALRDGVVTLGDKVVVVQKATGDAQW